VRFRSPHAIVTTLAATLAACAGTPPYRAPVLTGPRYDSGSVPAQFAVVVQKTGPQRYEVDGAVFDFNGLAQHLKSDDATPVLVRGAASDVDSMCIALLGMEIHRPLFVARNSGAARGLSMTMDAQATTFLASACRN
jgi:hypothetical protein